MSSLLRILILTCFTFLPFSQIFSQSLGSVKKIYNMQGEKLELESLLKDRIAIFIFYSTDCPLCIKYTKTVQDIIEEFESTVDVYTVFSGKNQEVEKIENFLTKYQLKAKIILDPSYNLADEFGAKITPESFLVSKSEVVYSGALDDWVIKLGSTKTEVRAPYLKNAIDAALRGEEAEPSKTKAIGCYIK